jgi:hypothetical protein
MTIISSQTPRTSCRVAPPTPFWFDLAVSPRTNVVSGSIVGQVTVGDRIYDRRTAATVNNEGDLILSFPRPPSVPASIEWESSNPSVVTVDSNGKTSRVSDGVATITCTVTAGADAVTRSVAQTLIQVASSQVDTFSSHVPGSLAAHCTAAIDSRIAGKTAAAAKPIFSTQNHIIGSYTRNPACWAAGIDLTCLSPWNSAGGAQMAGTLITPRHILMAAHFEIPVGASLRFVTNDNVVVTRTLIGVRRHPAFHPFFPDLTVGLLHSDVSTGITPCRVLPANWRDYLPTDIGEIPCLAVDAQENALVTEGGYISPPWGQKATVFDSPNAAQRLAFYEPLISGDSGNPGFLIVAGQPVLLTLWTYGGAGSGTSVTYYRTDLNGMITAVDTAAGVNTGYTLSTVELSGFPTY